MLPIQKLPITKKTDKWREECLDALETLCYGNQTRYRSDRLRKRINYDLFNGKFDKNDLQYVINPYGSDEGTAPADLQHYDIISPDLLLLMGEEAKRPFNFRVVTEGSPGVNAALTKKKELIDMYLQAVLFNKETGQSMNPEEIEKYMKYTFKDLKEQSAQTLLDFLLKKNNLEALFNEAWKDVLVAGEEIYYIGEAGGEPYVELCNPIDVNFVIDDNSTDIADSSAIVYRRNMSLAQIVDLWYDDLKPDDLTRLEAQINSFKGSTGQNSGSTVNYIPTYVTFNAADNGDGTGRIVGNGSTSAGTSASATIPVFRAEWRSLKKIGVLTYVDDNGETQETIVDEAYVKATGEDVEWFWISEWWEGVKIADDIYVNIRPKRIQRRSMDNISVCKPGFVGRIYNARNSTSISLIDRMKPYQYLYNIIYYRLELGMAKSMGKAAVIDITQIPRSAGFSLDKWLHYFKNLGIIFIDPLQKPENGGDHSTFNQYTVLDMEMGQFINQHVLLLDKIEDRMSQLSGVSRQRKGQITQEDGLGTSERAVTQSSHITEYWFKNHNDVKKQVLEALLDVSKHLVTESKSLQYITDDMGKLFFTIDVEDFANTQYGLFVSNSTKDERLLESLRQLSQVALQYDKANLSDIVAMMESNSVAEIKNKLKQGEEDAYKRQMAQQQSGEQAQIQQTQMLVEDKEKDRALKKYEIDSNNETKIQVETIRTYIGQDETDKDGSGQPDPIELQKLALEERKIAASLAAEHLGLQDATQERIHSSIENEKDRNLEREKMQNDIKLERMKPKPKPAPKKK